MCTYLGTFVTALKRFAKGVPLPVRCRLVLGTDSFMCHVPGTDSNCSGIPNSCH
jgi:hypothetical protein